MLTIINDYVLLLTMNLKTYLAGKSRQEFAEKIESTVHYINNLCQGAATPGKNLALRIEQTTGGAVTLRELLFPQETKP